MRLVTSFTIATLATIATVLSFAGCAAPTAATKAQDAAHELNINARFGRMELAVERVATKERDEFVKRHRGWGQAIRIADVELAGAKMKGEKDAEMMVRVGWYRAAEQELRSTTIRQSWSCAKGDWQLVGETRSEGDLGLMGETVMVEKPSEPKRPAYFQTVRIGSAEQ